MMYNTVTFCAKNENATNTGAVYQHFSALLRPSDTDRLKLCFINTKKASKTPPKSQCDVCVIDKKIDALRSNIMLKNGGSLIGFTPIRSKAATIIFGNLYSLDRAVDNGLPRNRCKLFGYPKLDTLFISQIEKDTIRQIFLRYAGLKDRKTILALGNIFVNSKIKELLKDCNLVVKQKNKKIRCISGWPSLFYYNEQDLIPAMLAADVLITDNTQAAIDFLALDRKIVFLRVNKLDNFDFGVTLDKAIELALEEDNQDRSEYIERFHPIRDGKAAERVIDLIVEKLDARQ